MEKNLGIYIHVPFCGSKCPYCDFYSARPSQGELEEYIAGMEKRLREYGTKYARPVDTVYLGGGTPSLLGGEGIGRILSACRQFFPVLPQAEISCEVNPGLAPDFFPLAAKAGVNRISMGLQSADPEELRFLGRRHSPQDVVRAVAAAREAGIENISLDLMMALPGQKEETLARSIDFCASLQVPHISAYLLKVEEGTPFFERGVAPPEEDRAADLYLMAAEALEEAGYRQYEISNFSIPGLESRHNLKYWRCQEYLGLGPSAHSFVDGRRFYFPRDTRAFLRGEDPVDDGEGGDFQEFAMLALRLWEGVRREDCLARFPGGETLFRRLREQAAKIPAQAGLVRWTEDSVSLTRKGFLLSNQLICRLVL
jgi:oxygen-independent coproporphyrinogen-3 oxidase